MKTLLLKGTDGLSVKTMYFKLQMHCIWQETIMNDTLQIAPLVYVRGGGEMPHFGMCEQFINVLHNAVPIAVPKM